MQSWEAEKKGWSDEVEYVNGLPAAQQVDAMGPVQQAIDDYAQKYYRTWKGYLEGLQLRKSKGAVPGWLKGLSESTELARLLRPAAQAVPAEGSTGGPPYNVFEQRMEGLRSLRPFVDGQLGEYQGLLGQVAKDLDEGTKNSSFLRQYRAQLLAHEKANNLVMARSWVEEKGGPSLAEGSLRTLLLGPLNEAEAYVQSPDLTMKQWEALQGLYKNVAARFPFAGKDSEEAADLKDIVALLGGQSGLVPVLQEVAKNQAISAKARAWLDRGVGLSRALFDEGKDDPRPCKLRLTVGDPSYEPKELSEDFQISVVRIYLGENSDFAWKPSDPKTKNLSVPLFGDNASTFSSAVAQVAEKKGALGRAFGKDFRPPEERKAAQTEGAWAPLKLLEKGLPGEIDASEGNTLNLVYTFEVPYKKNQPGKLKIPVKAEGTGIVQLIRLMQEGLERPPAIITGE